jgi:phospholipase C
LTANPEVWSKTALFLTYDENDGFFDHVVPQIPPMDRRRGSVNADRRIRSASIISMLDSLHLAKVVEGDLAWP